MFYLFIIFTLIYSKNNGIKTKTQARKMSQLNSKVLKISDYMTTRINIFRALEQALNKG